MTQPKNATRRVEVRMRFVMELPVDRDERREMYGAADPGECVEIDLENDPAACLTEWSSEVTGWTWLDD